MGWKRIVWYGVWYWFLGGALTMVQFLGIVHPVASQLIFYGFAFLVPIFFAYVFFVRMMGRSTWIAGGQLTASWIALFSVLDGVVFVWWLEFPLRVYFSWQLGLVYSAMLIVCMVVAEIVGRMKHSQGPEGLA